MSRLCTTRRVGRIAYLCDGERQRSWQPRALAIEYATRELGSLQSLLGFSILCVVSRLFASLTRESEYQMKVWTVVYVYDLRRTGVNVVGHEIGARTPLLPTTRENEGAHSLVYSYDMPSDQHLRYPMRRLRWQCLPSLCYYLIGCSVVESQLLEPEVGKAWRKSSAQRRLLAGSATSILRRSEAVVEEQDR